MKLPTRLMFLTNELPRLSDSSGALAGRFLIIQFTESFFGREDVALTDTLLKELPGILLWAIDGWKRVRARGRFIQPKQAEEAQEQLADLSSPVAAFVRDRCVIGPYRVGVDELYREWSSWCHREGWNTASTKAMFGRDLGCCIPAHHQTGVTIRGHLLRSIGLGSSAAAVV